MSRLALGGLLVAILLHGAALAWLASLERAGPARVDVALPEGGPPATLYLPRAGGSRGLPPPLPRGERPPALLLAHGFSADRDMMSSLARRVAASGIAVLAVDFPGHGESRAPFRRDVHGEPLAGVLAGAAEYLRASPWVDGTRLAVAGHSMGAWAALRFAEDDGAVEATLLLSGSGVLLGPYLPPNPLVLWAERDPPDLRERARRLADELAERLAGVGALPLGRTRGDRGEGRAVRAVEVAGHDHLTMLWAEATARESVAWLAPAFGLDAPAEPFPGDPRLAGLAAAGGTLVLALTLLGPALGALATRRPRARVQPAALPVLAGGLVLALPLAALAPPAGFLELEVGEFVVAHLALAGAGLLALLALAGRRPHLGPRPGRSLLAGLGAFAAVYALCVPLGPVVHRLVPTPERLLATAGAAALLLPFFLAFEGLLRRGPPWAAVLQGVAGRALVLVVLALGASTGLLPGFVMLALGPLALVFALAEVVAAGAYARSGDVLALAALEAAWVGWIVAVTMPIRA